MQSVECDQVQPMHLFQGMIQKLYTRIQSLYHRGVFLSLPITTTTNRSYQQSVCYVYTLYLYYTPAAMPVPQW